MDVANLPNGTVLRDRDSGAQYHIHKPTRPREAGEPPANHYIGDFVGRELHTTVIYHWEIGPGKLFQIVPKESVW